MYLECMQGSFGVFIQHSFGVFIPVFFECTFRAYRALVRVYLECMQGSFWSVYWAVVSVFVESI